MRTRPPLGLARLRRASLAIVLGARLASASAADEDVVLHLAESAGVARRAAPVTTGVPLPRGAVRDPARTWVADARGVPAPSQTAVLERWPDGTVRWLLIDFLAAVAGYGEARYAFRQGAPPGAPGGPRARLERRADAWVIDTGPIRVAVPANGSALVRDVEAGGRRLTGGIPLPTLTIAGAEPAPPAPDPPRVETEGPVRIELLLRGRWRDGAAYEARLAAFAGLPALRLRYTLTNLGDAPSLPIRGLALVLPGDFTAASLGLGGAVHRLDPLSDAHTLRQDDATDALLDGRPGRGRAECWAAANGRAGAIVLVTPLCWQQYPQALRVAPKAVRLDLLAGGDAPVALGRGAAKTHELWLVVERAPGTAAPREMAAALASPVVAHVDPRWVVRSRALAQALAPDDVGAESFLRRLTDAVGRYQARAAAERWDEGPPVACEARTAERPRVGFYGALNWGDWNFPGYRDRSKGCDAWGNLEYDLPQVLGLGWIATGSRRLFDGFVAAALHYRDVDIIHHDPEHPDRVGLNHPHKPGHFAREATQNVDLGHAWLEGLVTHYRLTGERRSLEAARAMGDALASRVGKAKNPRHFGWPMIALAALADATGDERYRSAARRFADGAVGAWEPTPAAADWKIGILADGLAAVTALDTDATLTGWLTRYADALVSAPPERYPDARYALPLGTLAARTGDRRYRERALAVAADLRIGDWGKALALAGRTGFRLLGPLAAQQEGRGPLAVTGGPAGPPRGSAAARRRR